MCVHTKHGGSDKVLKRKKIIQGTFLLQSFNPYQDLDAGSGCESGENLRKKKPIKSFSPLYSRYPKL